MGKKAKKSGGPDLDLGAWEGLTFSKSHGLSETKYSQADLLVRMEFKAALAKDERAIKAILEKLQAGLVFRDRIEQSEWRDPYANDRRTPMERSRNADLALLVLGICSISDQAVDKILTAPSYAKDKLLRQLEPTWVEDWVMEKWGTHAHRRSRKERLQGGLDRMPTKWKANKETIIDDLMSIRGPEGSRFAPGESGNRKGRPRKRKKHLSSFDEFYLEMVTFTEFGKPCRMTRYDAFMRTLIHEALKGNEKIRRLIAPLISKIEKERLKVLNKPVRIVIRG